MAVRAPSGSRRLPTIGSEAAATLSASIWSAGVACSNHRARSASVGAGYRLSGRAVIARAYPAADWRTGQLRRVVHPASKCDLHHVDAAAGSPLASLTMTKSALAITEEHQDLADAALGQFNRLGSRAQLPAPHPRIRAPTPPRSGPPAPNSAGTDWPSPRSTAVPGSVCLNLRSSPRWPAANCPPARSCRLCRPRWSSTATPRMVFAPNYFRPGRRHHRGSPRARRLGEHRC